jgi:hypothetical protein
MYGVLFDQTYITMAVFALLIFLIMFLWRKITIIEGGLFILEKRVDVIKKTDRLETINKNIESADVVMNEIFKDSTNNNFCNNISSNKCNIDNKLQKNKKNNLDINEQQFNNKENVINYINILNSEEIEIKKDDDVREKDQISTYLGEIMSENYDNFEITEVKLNTDNVINLQSLHNIQNNIGDVVDISNSNSYTDNTENTDNTDNISISSDITFGNDIDNNLKKKYKNMNVEKLREECKEKSLNPEGTKATLISRILEYNKKLK